MSTPPADPVSPWTQAMGFHVRVANPVKGTKIVLALSDTSETPDQSKVVFGPYDLDGTALNPFSLLGSSNGTDPDISVPFHELQLGPRQITLLFSGDVSGGGINNTYSLYIYVWAQDKVKTVRITRSAADKNVDLYGAFITDFGEDSMTNLQANTFVEKSF